MLLIIYYFNFYSLQVIDECNKSERWLQEKTRQQDALSKDADPVLRASEIKRKAEALNA